MNQDFPALECPIINRTSGLLCRQAVFGSISATSRSRSMNRAVDPPPAWPPVSALAGFGSRGGGDDACAEDVSAAVTGTNSSFLQNAQTLVSSGTTSWHLVHLSMKRLAPVAPLASRRAPLDRSATDPCASVRRHNMRPRSARRFAHGVRTPRTPRAWR